MLGLGCYIGLIKAALYKPVGLLQTPHILMLNQAGKQASRQGGNRLAGKQTSKQARRQWAGRQAGRLIGR